MQIQSAPRSGSQLFNPLSLVQNSGRHIDSFTSPHSSQDEEKQIQVFTLIIMHPVMSSIVKQGHGAPLTKETNCKPLSISLSLFNLMPSERYNWAEWKNFH